MAKVDWSVGESHTYTFSSKGLVKGSLKEVIMFRLTTYKSSQVLTIHNRDLGRPVLNIPLDKDWSRWPPPAVEVLCRAWEKFGPNEKEFLDLTGEWLRISVFFEPGKFEICEQTGSIRQLANNVFSRRIIGFGNTDETSGRWVINSFGKKVASIPALPLSSLHSLLEILKRALAEALPEDRKYFMRPFEALAGENWVVWK